MTRKSIPEAPMCHVDDAMVVHMFGDTPRKADRFPELAPQQPDPAPGLAFWVVVFAAFSTVAAVIIAFELVVS